MASLAVFLIIVLACFSAPLYAKWAGTDPFASTLDAVIQIDGADVPVMEQSTEGLGLGYTPIGPTWRLGNYFLGADSQGRDVMARLLYGGLNSLLISGAATIFTLIFGTMAGLIAGYFGGITDTVLSRLLDVLWAFPIYLLAISLSIVTIAQGIAIGPIEIQSGSLWLPIIIIGIVYIPYVARPIRGQVLALRHSEFVLAAINLGVPGWRILWRVVVPISRPTLSVLLIFFFIWTWNEFLIPLTFLVSNDNQTVPVAISALQGDRLMDVTTTSASALLGLIPTLVFFLIFQRTLTRGITAGAVK